MRPAMLCVLAISCSSPHTAERTGDIAIVDVTVVPMSRDGALPHQTVIVHGDRIVLIAPSASLTLGASTKTIDGAGKWLMPGLADMHVHTWRDADLTMFVAAGVTTIRNMWGVPQDVTWRSELASGARFGPTLVTAGSLIDGDPPDWPGSIVLTNPADADAIVVAQQAAGYDFLKSVNRLTRDAYTALVAAAARHHMLLSGHVPEAVGVDGALAAHQRSIEHLDGYLAALVPPGPGMPSDDDYQPWLRAVQARIDFSLLPGLVARTIAAGTWNCPTLIIYDRWPELYDAAAIQARVKWLPLVPAATRARWLHRFATRHASADDTAAVRANLVLLGKIAAALAAANAPILVGTDTGGDYNVPGEGLHDEIELLVAAGVPRAQVMRAATADAWRYFGRPLEAGVIDVGARADLVLTSTDPRTAPLPLVPDGVMLRGTWLTHDDLEARLTAIANRPAPASPWHDGIQYASTLDGTVVLRERVSVDGTTTRGDIVDLAEDDTTSYELGSATATLGWTHHTMTLALHAAIAGGELVVTGHDLTGKAVALRAPIPAGAFLSSPGIAGTMQLAARVADLAPGGKRTLTSIELVADPVAIVTTRYVVERTTDRERIYNVAATRHHATTTSRLVVDPAGIVELDADDVIARRQ
ncbi:MAG TPA: amidohydrolase family protein [Kofleriaceae bacterium]